ncbi:hypothetical protein ACGF12_31650 [Kitasatospora sp. NPDC048296]|uniref:hypothetical protein n=1 Tax=Kitasatospora sp. NPDC048296 TaxID=3364048 RepID=UPI0037120CDD
MGLSTIRVVMARLEPSHVNPPSGPAGPLVEDLIWAHARPSDGLEHLTVMPAGQGLELYFFVQAASRAATLAQVRALIDRVSGPLSTHGFALDRR